VEIDDKEGGRWETGKVRRENFLRRDFFDLEIC
jgi:hypothetical protein